MLVTMILSALLMLGGAAASDLQLYSKSIHRDKTLLSGSDGRHTVRKQPHQQTKNEISRSLDLESFNIHVSPTTNKVSLPTIIRLYPPTSKPLYQHANMPLRFGRELNLGDETTKNSNPNLPQRFGRSWEVIRMCAKCYKIQEAPNPEFPRRFGQNSPYWSFLRTLSSDRLLNAGLHWAKDFDFATSSEEVKMEEKTFKGRMGLHRPTVRSANM